MAGCLSSSQNLTGFGPGSAKVLAILNCRATLDIGGGSLSGIVKILDFGLAKQMEQRASETDTTLTMRTTTNDGTVMGTAAYMSPE